MKGTKKLTLIVVLAMVMNLFAFTGVYAADARMQTYWFDMNDSEVAVISMNVKVTEPANRYSLDFSAPTNDSALQDLYYKQTGGMIAIRNEMMSFRNEGTWIANGQELAAGTVSADFESDVWNNLLLKHKRVTGEVEVYLNDAYVGKYTLATPCGKPMNAVTIVADETITSGCEIEIGYVRGAKDGVLDATLADMNIDAKTFTLEFSENIANPDLLDDVVIKNTNIKDGEKEIALTATVVDDATVSYTWTDTLEAATEYAVVLPENLTGISGDKCIGEYVYFSTGNNKSELISECNYNDGQATVWLETVVEGASLILDTNDDHVKAYNVAALSDAGFQNIWKMGIPEEDFYTISFDIKPAQERLKMGIEFRPTSGNPVSIAYGIGGYVLAMSDWMNDGWLNFEDVTTTWANANTIAAYNTSDWINFKVEFDNIAGSITVYVNGEKKYTNTTFGELKEVAFRTPVESGYSKGTSLMLLDNVKTEKIVTPASVNQVRFVDEDNNEVKPFETLNEQLGSVRIGFNTAMAEENLKDAVKLYYGEEDIAYDGVYDASTNVYTLTPKSGTYVPSGTQVKVVVTDAADTSGEKASCTSYVSAGEFESYFNLDVVDAAGESVTQFTAGETYYVSISAADYSADPKKAHILIAQYKDSGIIEEVIPTELDISGEVTVNKESAAPLSFTAKSDVNTIKVFAWEANNIRPLVKSVNISKASE